MNTTQKIYTFLFGIIIVMLAYIITLQPKVKAGDEILEIKQQIEEKQKSILDHQERYRIAVESLNECAESWNEEMKKENEWANADRDDIADLEQKLGLILQSQLQ